MGFEIVIPDSINGGIYKQLGNWTFGLWAHSLQCNQRWIFLIGWFHNRRPYRFGYRTMGDAGSKTGTRKDAGWHWPWQDRACSGRN